MPCQLGQLWHHELYRDGISSTAGKETACTYRPCICRYSQGPARRTAAHQVGRPRRVRRRGGGGLDRRQEVLVDLLGRGVVPGGLLRIRRREVQQQRRRQRLARAARGASEQELRECGQMANKTGGRLPVHRDVLGTHRRRRGTPKCNAVAVSKCGVW